MNASKIVMSLLIVFSCMPQYAQVTANKFGTVSLDQLNMKSYSLDNQAEAVVLYDFGNTFFYESVNGFQIIFERTTRIKIFSKAGIPFAQISIPFYVENSQFEEVYEIQGITYNIENGMVRTTELKPEAIYSEKKSEHWMEKKFAMPDVAEGSVIEYKYKIISPYFFNFRDWEFQSKIPTVYSEYTVKMIPFYEYSYIFQGASKFDVFKNSETSFKRSFGGVEYPDNVFVFGMKNIPAFRDESFISSINDYIMKIDFQLSVVHHLNGADVDIITTWPLLIEELLKHNNFGSYLKSATKNAEEILVSLDLSGKSIPEKAEIITNYVKGTYNWNQYYGKFAEKSVKEFLKLKTGNCAEINLFLCGLLNVAGITAYPMILSTRDHGIIPLDYPFEQFMNYVIVYTKLDGHPVMLDATSSLCPFGMLPSRCINGKGLVVDKTKVEWIPLVDEIISAQTDSLVMLLNESLDSARILVNISTTGHKASEYRGSYISDPKNFSKSITDDEIEMVKPLTVKNEKNIRQPFAFCYEALVSVETVANKILITPFPGLVMTENPLKAGYRTYPVDIVYAFTKNLYLTLKIPDGYRYVDSLKGLNMDNDLMNITYKAEQVSDQLIISGTYSFKKSIYKPNEYIRLKNQLANVVAVFNEKIMIEKE
jgi:hypothetical protein